MPLANSGARGAAPARFDAAALPHRGEKNCPKNVSTNILNISGSPSKISKSRNFGIAMLERSTEAARSCPEALQKKARRELLARTGRSRSSVRKARFSSASRGHTPLFPNRFVPLPPLSQLQQVSRGPPTRPPNMAPEAWFMDTSDADQRLPHRLEPNEPVSLEKLAELGVLYWKIDADNWKTDETLAQIRKDRGYSYEDLITCTPEKLPNYEEKIKTFYEEHIHTDEEIRFVVDGSGYFDVRDKDDRWIRIDVRKGDLIILPAGIYHRFTLDTNNHITALRLFVGEPIWTPYNRPADNMDARVNYVKQFLAVPAQ